MINGSNKPGPVDLIRHKHQAHIAGLVLLLRHHCGPGIVHHLCHDHGPGLSVLLCHIRPTSDPVDGVYLTLDVNVNLWRSRNEMIEKLDSWVSFHSWVIEWKQ